MNLKEPYLIIDLNNNKIIFFVILFDEKKKFRILKNVILEAAGIQDGRIVNIEIVTKLIKKTITDIEDDVNHFFSNVSVIIDPSKINCLNVSGYKKLNGSQVSSEDITYILNDIKKIILNSENQYSLVHLFNSNFSLDSDNLENLPIGLFGEFYNQNMTFFLANKNIIKNIKLTFKNCGLNVERIILKSFAEGVNLLSNSNLDKNFTILRLEKNRINISLFKNKSFVFTEDFNFGINLAIKDVAKLCSLRIIEVENILKKIELEHVLENNNESFLEKEYFYISPYRKIKYQLILDIILARLEELFEVCYKNNTNIKNLKNNDKIYFYVETYEYYKNIKFILARTKLTTVECIYDNNSKENISAFAYGACELIINGWEKEAIPVIHKKKSFISGFFSKLFS